MLVYNSSDSMTFGIYGKKCRKSGTLGRKSLPEKTIGRFSLQQIGMKAARAPLPTLDKVAAPPMHGL